MVKLRRILLISGIMLVFGGLGGVINESYAGCLRSECKDGCTLNGKTCSGGCKKTTSNCDTCAGTCGGTATEETDCGCT